jgi:hypothetical protein
LEGKRFVQAIEASYDRDALGIRGFAEHELDRIAGQHMDDGEDHH